MLLSKGSARVRAAKPQPSLRPTFDPSTLLRVDGRGRRSLSRVAARLRFGLNYPMGSLAESFASALRPTLR